MRCPKDGSTLATTRRSGIEIDYCPDCRGVWLDRGELNKLIIRAGLPGPHYTARRMAAPADDQTGEVPEPHTGDLLGEIFDL